MAIQKKIKIEVIMMTCGECVVCRNWVWGNVDVCIVIDNKKGWKYLVCNTDMEKTEKIIESMKTCEAK